MPKQSDVDNCVESFLAIPDIVGGKTVYAKTKQKFRLSLAGFKTKEVFQLVDGDPGTAVSRCAYNKKFKMLIKENEHLQAIAYNTIEQAMVHPDSPWHVRVRAASIVVDRVEPITRHSEQVVKHEIHPVKLTAYETKKISKQLEDGNTIDADYEEIQDDTA